MKLGPRRKDDKGQDGWLANILSRDLLCDFGNFAEGSFTALATGGQPGQGAGDRLGLCSDVVGETDKMQENSWVNIIKKDRKLRNFCGDKYGNN